MKQNRATTTAAPKITPSTKKLISTKTSTTTSKPITNTHKPVSVLNRFAAVTARNNFFRSSTIATPSFMSPIKTTAKTTTTTTKTTTTTTEQSSVDEEDYADIDDVQQSTLYKEKDAEEDPKVIKELIELIRRVGGIEELEKHLLRKDDGTISIKHQNINEYNGETVASTTPSTFSKSLYDKVLRKPNSYNTIRNRFNANNDYKQKTNDEQNNAKVFTDTEVDEDMILEQQQQRNNNQNIGNNSEIKATAGYSKYSSVVRGNSRQGPQNEGLEKLLEFQGFQKEKKQYVTINRGRNKQKSSDLREDLIDPLENSEPEIEETDLSSERGLPLRESTDRIVGATQTTNILSVTPSYTNIRRTRPTTTAAPFTTITATSAINSDDYTLPEIANARKSYTPLNRNRIKTLSTEETDTVTIPTTSASVK